MKNEEIINDDDDDWITGQAKLVEQQHKVFEIGKILKSLEEFNNNIEKIKKVCILCFYFFVKFLIYYLTNIPTK